ncbi:hypothetical protein [Metamycoplasma hyosynoviae]|uniref:hypothetical protein n=1 Tax=Metamycoplasma hyosynoviae TaxID=29559 RepID=UPI000461D75B|nr:hypothetical protein [Metamycoplasma hyosynoviae]KDE42910.1 hypothetical protein NPL1_02245 [Metamycoplasma hyosynoviae]MDC8914191.1 hypothetical protein [Metamycoplasma hyosynoviae]MDD1360674.1 hypothetical protein [Metamycoplasma hyosynoviae]MDD1362211.1 hypothetical protein [Metamycoplasma hyosynoviae]MDD7884152.1 hypothetical protein [Metamycoplasma hyosynoviae]
MDINKLSKQQINELAYNWYFEVIKKMSKTNPIAKFNELKISDYYKNYKVPTSKGMMWKYNRHHLIEINITGALINSKGLESRELINTPAIIVSLEQHAFLHYLIVLTQRTLPNDGIRLQISDHEWDKIIQEQCKIYDIPYISNWPSYINNTEEYVNARTKMEKEL